MFPAFGSESHQAKLNPSCCPAPSLERGNRMSGAVEIIGHSSSFTLSCGFHAIRGRERTVSRDRIWTAAFLFHAIIGAASAEPGHGVGARSVTASALARGETIELTVWYPTDVKGPVATIGASKVFKGTRGLRNAPVAKGQYSVIVLAHGRFQAPGTMRAGSHPRWLLAATSSA
jgi:hypothetical protein